MAYFSGASTREARVGQSPIPIDYGQPQYVRTYASTDCTGGVGETIERKGGVSQACLAKSISFTLQLFYIAHSQYGQLTAVKTG